MYDSVSLKLSLISKSAVGHAQEVTVALQTEEFGRLVNTFSIKTGFWSILEYFETEKNLNLTKRSGTFSHSFSIIVKVNIIFLRFCFDVVISKNMCSKK